MNLLKWFRKNNTKILAVVVIVIMFGFVGGSALRSFLQRGGSPLKKTVAYYLEDTKITRGDIQRARNELELLRALRADVLLRSLSEPLTGRTDLPSFFLGELLFSETLSSPALLGDIRELIRRNGYNISLKQLSDFYRGTVPNDIYWLLLTKEAELAGFRISNRDAGTFLAVAIQRVIQGTSYPEFIGSVIKTRGIPEEGILKVFGKLLAVRDYAELSCSGENITSQQIKHQISFVQETLNTDFVRFNSSIFAEDENEPSRQQIVSHFEKYRRFYSGEIGEDNPYAFGYKLPSRIQLEYLAVKLDDAVELVEAPTEQDAEDYYLNNKDRFTEKVPVDANNPDSETTEKTRSYPEVSNQILRHLLRQRKNMKAQEIIEEAVRLTEAGYEGVDVSDISEERYKQLAGDYSSAAAKMSTKHGIRIYTGTTGHLSATDMRQDAYLGKMYMKASVQSILGLTQLVFSVEELGDSELGPLGVQKPRMYENISPVRDMTNRIMGCIRIIDAEKEAVPDGVDVSFSKATLELGEGDAENVSEQENLYRVEEQVVEDLKQLGAMDFTRKKAGDFKRQIAKLGWDAAIDRFNELYGEADANESLDEAVLPEDEAESKKTFELITLKNLKRISNKDILSLEVQNRGDPAGQFSLIMARKEGELLDRLYSLIPSDSNSLDEVPYILEFKPDLSYYCIKNLFVNEVDRAGYQQLKALQSYREKVAQTQSLSAIHFNPGNILKRMNFRPVKEEEASDANSPAKAAWSP